MDAEHSYPYLKSVKHIGGAKYTVATSKLSISRKKEFFLIKQGVTSYLGATSLPIILRTRQTLNASVDTEHRLLLMYSLHVPS
jgi:hypothetical protein